MLDALVRVHGQLGDSGRDRTTHHTCRVVPGRVHDAAASTRPAARGRSSTRCATSSPSEPASRRRCWSRSKRAGGCSCCDGTTSPPAVWNVSSNAPATSMRRSSRHRSHWAASSGSRHPWHAAMHRTVIRGRRSTTPGCRSRRPACPRRRASTPGIAIATERQRACIVSTRSSPRPSSPTSSTRWPPPRSHQRGGRCARSPPRARRRSVSAVPSA